MRRGWLIALVLLAAGCGKKVKPAADDGQADFSGGFVEISLDEEEEALEDMLASELMVAVAECGDLLALEPAAMLGQLDDAQIRCLDEKLKAAERQTVKDKLSRVLMTDAWAKGDEHRWEGVVRRHLEEIDRSDPDLCYKFSYYLSQRSADQMDEALKWADVALENRSVWTGDLHVKRVYSLFKIKALSAQKKWTHLEEKYVEEPSEQLLEEKDGARNETKTLAREWLEYARQSGKDETLPLQLCRSAAGTSGFCEDT